MTHDSEYLSLCVIDWAPQQKSHVWKCMAEETCLTRAARKQNETKGVEDRNIPFQVMPHDPSYLTRLHLLIEQSALNSFVG